MKFLKELIRKEGPPCKSKDERGKNLKKKRGMSRESLHIVRNQLLSWARGLTRRQFSKG